jgi:hypothetical protein
VEEEKYQFQGKQICIFFGPQKNARIFNLSFSYQLQKAKYDITFLIVVARRVWLSKYETKY